MGLLRYFECTVFVIFVVLLNAEIICSNGTYRYYENVFDDNHIFRTRQQKLIEFNTDGEIKLDLDFNVPFIKLPIKKSMDMAKASLISLNLGSLVLTGVIVFAAAVIFPLVLALFDKKGFIPPNSPMNVFYARSGFPRDNQATMMIGDPNQSTVDAEKMQKNCTSLK